MTETQRVKPLKRNEEPDEDPKKNERRIKEEEEEGKKSKMANRRQLRDEHGRIE